MMDEKRSWTRKDVGREKILDEKRCWTRKDVGREKILDEKRCWTRKDVGRIVVINKVGKYRKSDRRTKSDDESKCIKIMIRSSPFIDNKKIMCLQ